jgi:hypothetical protein
MFKSSPKDLQVEVEKLTGIFRGVVEDNNDPLKAGKVRIRIHGLHSANKNKSDIDGIPTEELPWAEPALPIYEGSVSGFGAFSVPLNGSQVAVYFENGNLNRPIYFASLPGIPQDQEQYYNNNKANDNNTGFKDPDGNYPTKHRLGEPDFHRLARENSSETLVTTKNNNLDIGIPTALGGSWNEPESGYASKYPENFVINVHGGITIELDSTPGSTRLNIYHPSNSFIEIDNDGNMVVKNNGEKYEIVTQGKNIHIKQQKNETVDAGSKLKIEDDQEIEIGGNRTEQISGNVDQIIDGNKTEDITSDKTETIGGSKTEDITSDKTETIGGSKTSNITSNKTETITGSKTETITGSKTETIGNGLNITVSGTSNITSTGSIQISGPTIGITGGVSLADQGTLLRLVNELFVDLFNNHVHGGIVNGGSLTQVPTVLMDSTELTTNVRSS